MTENEPGTKAAAAGLSILGFLVVLKPLACMWTLALLFLSADEGGLTGSRIIVLEGVEGLDVAEADGDGDAVPPTLDTRCLPGLLVLSSLPGAGLPDLDASLPAVLPGASFLL